MYVEKGGMRIVRDALVPSGMALLEGELIIPVSASGIVLFVHGSGSSRHSPRNKYVAGVLNDASIGTLLFGLLTKEEEEEDKYTGHLRFDIDLLAKRLMDATRWVRNQEDAEGFPLGYFGSSTGAAAALVAEVAGGNGIAAIVSRGGRADLAGAALPYVKAPTLLIVGERDEPVIKLNWQAYERMRCEKRVEIVERATHLFEESGTLEEVARLAAEWFRAHFERSRHTVST